MEPRVRSSIINIGRFPHFFQPVGRAGWGFVWLVAHQSEPVTKYHTAWAVKCCRYRCNCMFCFQPNELRWCVPVQEHNINEKTREEPPPPPLIAKIMMSLSERCNEQLTRTQTHTHTHSGGHFQPINSEWAQSRIENNLYQSKAGLDNSSNDPPPPHLNAWLLTGPWFHFSSQKFPHAHFSCLVLSCRILETVAVIITETAPVLEGPKTNWQWAAQI